MKRYFGIGLVIIAGALTTLTLNAASGDAIYVKAGADALADTNPKRNALRDLVREMAPGIAIANVQSVECFQTKRGQTQLQMAVRPNWICRGERTDTRTDAELLDDVLLGTVRDTANSSSKLGPITASSAGQIAAIDGVTEAILGKDIEAVAHVSCARQEVGNPICVWFEIVTDTPANWKADLDAGNVVGTIGKVE